MGQYLTVKRLFFYFYRRIYLIKRWAGRRFTAGGKFVLFCMAGTALVGIDTKQTLAYQIFTLLSAILATSMISGFFFRIRISAARILPRFGTVGEPVEYRIEITNKSGKVQNGLRIFENFTDACPSTEEYIAAREPNEERRNFIDRVFGYYRFLWLVSRKKQAETIPGPLVSIPAGGKIDLTLKLLPTRRGPLKMTAVVIARPDPFGLFNACVTHPLQDTMLIIPRRYTLPDLKLAGTRKYQAGGVALASSVGDSEEFKSLRDYRPGDPLRKIHWKSWAKTGQPVVKEYQDEFFVRHALILDTFWKTEHDDLFEEAVSIASSFAFSIQSQDAILDLMFVGTEAYCFSSGRGLLHIDQILRIMASVIPCKDQPFSNLTSAVLNRAHLLSGCICILLSWDENRKDLIHRLKSIGVPVLVLVLDRDIESPAGFEPDGMALDPENFHTLTMGRIQEGLARI